MEFTAHSTKKMTKPNQPKKEKDKNKGKKKGKSNAGRPSLMTDKVIDDIANAVSIGSSYELSALYAGISYPTLQDWLRKARQARTKHEEGEKLDNTEKEFLRFLMAIDEANASAGISWQEVVHRSTKVDPDKALQMLRLRFSGYGGPQVNYTAEIDLNKLTEEQLERIAKGENPADVIASPGTSSSGAAPTSAGSPANSK